jgi:hypothetical protein
MQYHVPHPHYPHLSVHFLSTFHSLIPSDIALSKSLLGSKASAGGLVSLLRLGLSDLGGNSFDGHMEMICFSSDLPTSAFTMGGDMGAAGVGGDNGPIGKVIGGGEEVRNCCMVGGGGEDGGVGAGGEKSV